MRGFVREELPLVCQKCNPAVTCRDPALRGKLLRQKCVSVGAPSCLAPLSPSPSLFFLNTSASLPAFFPFPYSTISLSLLFFYLSLSSPVYLHYSFHLTANFMHSSLRINTCETPPPFYSPPPPSPSFHRRACEEGEALLSADRSFFFLSKGENKHTSTHSLALDRLQYRGLQSRTSGAGGEREKKERENDLWNRFGMG